MEAGNVFALVENAAGDVILNLRSERLFLLQIAWIVAIRICIVRREVIVCRTRLQQAILKSSDLVFASAREVPK
jgi:hypothetical protein